MKKPKELTGWIVVGKFGKVIALMLDNKTDDRLANLSTTLADAAYRGVQTHKVKIIYPAL